MKVRAVVVMGVSGSGKSTLGAALATRLGWDFVDADDHHPARNKAKMARGEALTDEDRAPWLGALHALLEGHLLEGKPLVLACSALKARYRETLTGGLSNVALVYAEGSRELISRRLRARAQTGSHFMPASLLDSQFEALERPEHAIRADIRLPVAALVEAVVGALEEVGEK